MTKPKYTVTVTKGTVLYKTYNPLHEFWTIGIYSTLVPKEYRAMPSPQGRIISICGKMFHEYREMNHNPGIWFRVRENVTLEDFEITEV
jgi:hypothetical protein